MQVNIAGNQSEFRENTCTCDQRQTRVSATEKVKIGLNGSAFHWLRKWSEFSCRIYRKRVNKPKANTNNFQHPNENRLRVLLLVLITFSQFWRFSKVLGKSRNPRRHIQDSHRLAIMT